MLSFEILCAQEGQLDKENFGISTLITSLYPMGFLQSLLTSFNAVAQLQTEGAEVLGLAPGSAVESKLGIKTPHIGVTFTSWLTV
jgi:hypothetical protein